MYFRLFGKSVCSVVRTQHSQIGVILIGQRLGGSILHLGLVLLHELGVDGDSRRCKGDFSDEFLNMVSK